MSRDDCPRCTQSVGLDCLPGQVFRDSACREAVLLIPKRICPDALAQTVELIQAVLEPDLGRQQAADLIMLSIKEALERYQTMLAEEEVSRHG